MNKVVTTANGSGFTERAENSLNAGVDSQSLSIAAGKVTARISAEVTGLSGTAIEFAELRSPVRVGEQITLLDRVDEPVADVDGDRVNDKADIAIYSRVIGNEAVDLPDLGRTVQALRVDQTLLIKIKLSGNGQIQAVANSIQSIWYQSGVGIVRRTSTALSTVGVGVIDTDERLRRWDGVTEGVGVMDVTSASFPTAQAPIPGALLREPLAAVGFGDHALVLTPDWSAQSAENGVALVNLNKRGVASAVQAYPQFKSLVNSKQTLLRVGNEAVLSLPENGPLIASVGPSFDLRLVRFTADGILAGNPAGVTVSLGAASAVQVASDGSNLWILWVRRDTSDSFNSPGRLYLQRFDVNGVSLAPPVLLDQSASGTYNAISLSADKGRVLASWAAGLFPAPVYRYALGSAGNGVSIQTLGTAVGNGNSAERTYLPFVSGDVAMLSWQGPLFDAPPFPDPASDQLLRGVLLNGSAALVRASSGSLDRELLPAALATPNAATLRVAADGRLIFANTATGMLFDGGVSTDYVDVRWFTPGNGPLAQVSPNRLRGAAPQFGSFAAVVTLEDRLLLLGARVGMTTMVVWLR